MYLRVPIFLFFLYFTPRSSTMRSRRTAAYSYSIIFAAARISFSSRAI